MKHDILSAEDGNGISGGKGLVETGSHAPANMASTLFEIYLLDYEKIFLTNILVKKVTFNDNKV